MELIQMAITNTSYATAFRDLLVRNGNWEVRCVDLPDMNRDGVMVVDCDHLARLPMPLPHPERVVLVARKDPLWLSRAWDAGVNSVVFDRDPLSTAVLAVMAARLRVAKARRNSPPHECSACGWPLPAPEQRKSPGVVSEPTASRRMVSGRSHERADS
ncbi:MAG: hypothetical protein IT160_09240 [Bryobacterales bacterium]|nr:hypothetical protein [Bryobacterales bacterium]